MFITFTAISSLLSKRLTKLKTVVGKNSTPDNHIRTLIPFPSDSAIRGAFFGQIMKIKS